MSCLRVCSLILTLNPMKRFWLNLVDDESVTEIQKPCWNKEWKSKSVLYEHAPVSWEMNKVIEMCVLCHSLSSILTEGNRNSGWWSRMGEFSITGTRTRQEKVRGCVPDTRKKENRSWACATWNINRGKRVDIPLVILRSVRPMFVWDCQRSVT